jgi:alginate O-acetyltransferase complex protein AlgI
LQLNSLEFIYSFLPAFLIIYYLIREQFRCHVLVLGSVVFYGLATNWSLLGAPLLVVLTVVAFLASKSLNRLKKGWLLGFWLLFFGGILLFFKLFRGGAHLPGGMSFYLFQIGAILIDVFRGRTRWEYDPVRFAANILMFPKLLSGPLVEPAALRSGERGWQGTWERFGEGLQLLIIGLALKVLLAGRLGGIWAQAKMVGYGSISTGYAWIALASWAMQLYFDFYGYSLMAVGLGKMLGYDLPENFRHPYAAGSVSRFYRRWHITLGAWFREYVYIPLGGNRRGTAATIVNLAVVWAFTGLWHGTGGNYLLWAAFLWLMVVLERLFLNKLLEKAGPVRHIYLIFVILLSWVPFAIGDWDQMCLFLSKLFGGGNTLNSGDVLGLTAYIPMLCTGIALATPLPEKLWNRIRTSFWGWSLLFILFWAVVFRISTAAQDPFLYFQF